MTSHFEAKKHAYKNPVRETNDPDTLEILVGQFWVKFSAQDAALIAPLRWSLTRGKTGGFYVRAYTGGGRQGQRAVRMHRHILPASIGFDIDHINRDTLDNRRSNLRIVTRSENLHNTVAPKHNKSGRKGVCWYPAYEMWRAYITRNRKQKTLGYFKTIEEASAARANAEASNA